MASVFEVLFIWETGHDKNAGRDNKRKEHHFNFFIELLLENVTVNETGAFGIHPDKGDKGQCFVYTLPFYKQLVYKQTVLAY